MVPLPVWIKPYFNSAAYVIGDNSKEGYGYLTHHENLKERTDKEVQGIIHLFPKRRARRKKFTILDVGCGYGRHSIALAACGFSVIGIDASDFLIRLARWRAKQGLNVWEQKIYSYSSSGQPLFYVKDVGRLPKHWKETFDTVISTSSAFDAYPRKEKIKIFKQLNSVIRPGGVFMYQPQYVRERLRFSGYLQEKQRTTLPIRIFGKHYPRGILWYLKKWDKQANVFSSTWQVEIHGAFIPTNPVESHVPVYTVIEQREMLKQAGFISIELFGSWRGEEWSRESEEILFRAVK